MELDSSTRRLVFDVEANGLLHDVTKLWCIYCIDKDTEEGFLFHDYPQYNGAEGVDDLGNPYVLPKRSGSLRQGAQFLSKAKQLICHNILGYDLFVLQKFFPKFKMRFAYPEIRDTLLESQVQWFDRPTVLGYKGIHGLAVWGARLGIRKPEIQDWSYIDADKLNRCIEDVKINLLTANKLEEEREKLLENCGLNFIKALEVEHEYRYNMTIQELNGALLDVKLAKELIVDLDNKLDKLSANVEPKLPMSFSVKGGKVSARECQKKLGVPEDQLPPEKTRQRVIKGVAKDFVIKKYYNPTTSFTSKESVNQYTIVTPDGTTLDGTWGKVKEARDYVKEVLKEPTKGYKYPKAVVETLMYNHHTCNHFECEPTDYGIPQGDTKWTIEAPFTKVTFTKTTMSQHDGVKSFLVRLGWEPDEWTIKKNSEGRPIRVDDDLCKAFHCAETAPERLHNKALIKEYERRYKEDYGKTYKVKMSDIVIAWPNNLPLEKRIIKVVKKGSLMESTPKLTESSYDSLPEGLGKDIADYYTYDHRRKYIQNPKEPNSKGLLAHVREDGRIPCGMQTFGTTSGRAAHYNVVNLPSPNALYGDNMRKLIKAPEGRTLVGIDMPNCHPRILSFLTGDKVMLNNPDAEVNLKFLDAIRSGSENDKDGNFLGTDFHSVNALLFSLVDEETYLMALETQDKGLIGVFLAARKKGKGCSFTCLYGGSGAKLAQTIGGISVQEGEERKADFINGLGLDVILDSLEEKWEKQKRAKGSYISVYGGYHIYCNSKHKMINTMAIGSEAALQKYSINWIVKEIDKHNLDVKIILSMHDEVLFEVADKDLEAFKPIGKRFYEEGAQLMGIDNDFNSDCLVGKTYYDCH